MIWSVLIIALYGPFYIVYPFVAFPFFYCLLTLYVCEVYPITYPIDPFIHVSEYSRFFVWIAAFFVAVMLIGDIVGVIASTAQLYLIFYEPDGRIVVGWSA